MSKWIYSATIFGEKATIRAVVVALHEKDAGSQLRAWARHTGEAGGELSMEHIGEACAGASRGVLLGTVEAHTDT